MCAALDWRDIAHASLRSLLKNKYILYLYVTGDVFRSCTMDASTDGECLIVYCTILIDVRNVELNLIQEV
jgi:hypothetical protein